MTYREALDALGIDDVLVNPATARPRLEAALIRAALTMPDAATGGLDEQKPLPKDFITTVARVLYAVRKGQIDQRDGITEILNAAAALAAAPGGLDVPPAVDAIIKASRVEMNGTCRFCGVGPSLMHDEGCEVEQLIRAFYPAYGKYSAALSEQPSLPVTFDAEDDPGETP